MQAIASDLLVEAHHLLIPAKDLLARASFQGLINLAGTGRGASYKLAILKELEDIYKPEIISDLNELLNGFLGIENSDPSGQLLSGLSDSDSRSFILASKPPAPSPIPLSSFSGENTNDVQPLPTKAALVTPVHTKRRASASPLGVSCSIFLLPASSLLIGFRQRSWGLAVIPFVIAIVTAVTVQLFAGKASSDVMARLAACAMGSITAYPLARFNKRQARYAIERTRES
jgi:hypothetical protein